MWMKKRILIIEDEYFFRQLLKKYINSYPEEFELVGEANNGRAGIELLESLSPDIALVDITMPMMNGIDVIREANSLGMGTKMIILTGYSEFEYAKEAIQLGVQDYLLKPVQIDELYQSLKKAALALDRDWLARDAQASVVANNNVDEAIHNRLMEKLLFGPLNTADLRDIRERLSFPEHGFYALALMDLSLKHSSIWHEKDRNVCNYAVENMLSEILPQPFRMSRRTLENGLLSIIFYSPLPDAEENQKILTEALESLGSLVDRHLCLPIMISVGTFCNSLHGIKDAYEEAVHLQKSHFFNDRHAIYYFDDQNTNHYQYSKDYFSEEDSRKLSSLIRSGDANTAGSFVHSVFQRLRDAAAPSETIYFCISELFATVLKSAAEYNIQLSYEKSDLSFYSHLFASKSLDELESFIMENIGTLLTNVGAKEGQDSQKALTKEIATYIDTHFGNCQMNLDSIAGAFFISTKYLCLIFKKHTGTTVGSYLLDTRMRHAKQFMEEGAENITAVARKCGYEDPNYFSKCFKKYYGVSPRRYLESIH